MRRKPAVVITRKDKRLHKGLHLAAFMLTGGASGIVTAAKAGTNAGYNARTRQLGAGEPAGPAAADREWARATVQRLEERHQRDG